MTPPVPELGAEYWVIVHRDLRRAACVRAVIDWIRRLFEERRDELAGAAAQPVTLSPRNRPQARHRPINFGFRFSRKAATPSALSAVMCSCGCTMLSISR